MKFSKEILTSTTLYNFHTHTQFCDGKDTMESMAASAWNGGLLHLGFTPHAPIACESPCNMRKESVKPYLNECNRLKELYACKINIYSSMEIDYLSRNFGPHIDYFQNLPLDYRLASVHFVNNQDGIFIDCDGSAERFIKNLKYGFRGDLRYVVEKYFEQVLTMIELGGFEMLGHLDKIAQNAVVADPDIESCRWYEALVNEVIEHACDAGIIIEINTKYIKEKGRFFPHERWWNKLNGYNAVAINSDAHYAEKISCGRKEAIIQLSKI